jgi:holo-[acyl-carrier protein] synthase
VPIDAERCGIDSLEIARMERLLRDTPADDLLKIFSAEELQDSGDGPRRAASLAARFAAKEACLKLFPRETALGTIEASDFSVVRDNYGAPHAFAHSPHPMCWSVPSRKASLCRSLMIA